MTPSLIPSSRLEPDSSHLWLWIICGLLWLGLVTAVVRAWRAFARARALRASVSKARSLRPGPVMLHGVAEAADDARPGDGEPLIELTIRQTGTKFKGNRGVEHTRWAETGRTLRDRPFLLRTDREERVRVEPGTELDLIDRLEPPLLDEDGNERLRVARIAVGDELWIRGELRDQRAPDGGPFRGGAAGFILVPSRGGRLFVSSQPVEDEGRRAGKLHLGFAALFALLVFVWQGVVFFDFQVLRSSGVPAQAKVIERLVHRPQSNRHSTRYAFRLGYEVGGVHFEGEEETTSLAFEDTPVGAEVPIVYFLRDPTSVQLGTPAELGVSAGACQAGTFMAIMALLGYAAMVALRNPWWRRKRLVEIDDRLAP